MLRALSGRFKNGRQGHGGFSSRTSRAVDENLGPVAAALSHTIEDDDISELYSDNEEQAEDYYRAQHLQREQRRHRKAYSSSRRKKSKSSRHDRRTFSNSSRKSIHKKDRPMLTVEIPPVDYASATELDEIIRSFSSARKASGYFPANYSPSSKDGVGNDDDHVDWSKSSSSYNSGFSSSSGSESGSRGLLDEIPLLKKSKKNLSSNLSCHSSSKNSRVHHSDHRDAKALESHLDVLSDFHGSPRAIFTRYGKAQEMAPKKKVKRSFRRSRFRDRGKGVAPTDREFGGEAQSEAGASDIRSQASSIFGFSISSDAIRRLWRRKARIEKNSGLDATETTAMESEHTTIPAEVVTRPTRSKKSSDGVGLKGMGRSPTIREILLTATTTPTRNASAENISKMVTPGKATTSAVGTRRSTRTKQNNAVSSKENRPLNAHGRPQGQELTPFVPRKPAGKKRKQKKRKKDPSKTDRVTKGYDCDTGLAATKEVVSKVPPASNSSHLTRTFLKQSADAILGQEIPDFEPRLEDPDVPLLDKTGRDCRPESAPAPTCRVIDPLDIEIVATNAADNSGVDDSLSSLSSGSSITVGGKSSGSSPQSVLDMRDDDDQFDDNPYEEKAVITPVKKFSSSPSPTALSPKGINGRALPPLSSHSSTLPPHSPVGEPVPAPSNNTAYVMPSSMRVGAPRMISVLLLEPVLKIFEIVSIGAPRGTSVGDAIEKAKAAAADRTLAKQTYISLCSDTKVAANLDLPVSKLAPKSKHSGAFVFNGGNEEEMKREMERRLLVAVPANSTAVGCQKIRRMLWKNEKLQAWWWQATHQMRQQPTLSQPYPVN